MPKHKTPVLTLGRKLCHIWVATEHLMRHAVVVSFSVREKVQVSPNTGLIRGSDDEDNEPWYEYGKSGWWINRPLAAGLKVVSLVASLCTLRT